MAISPLSSAAVSPLATVASTTTADTSSADPTSAEMEKQIQDGFNQITIDFVTRLLRRSTENMKEALRSMG